MLRIYIINRMILRMSRSSGAGGVSVVLRSVSEGSEPIAVPAKDLELEV